MIVGKEKMRGGKCSVEDEVEQGIVGDSKSERYRGGIGWNCGILGFELDLATSTKKIAYARVGREEAGWLPSQATRQAFSGLC